VELVPRHGAADDRLRIAFDPQSPSP
jgi:hypothetical protein